MKKLSPIFFCVLLAMNIASTWGQCADDFACNFDLNGTDPCNYNTSNQDLSQGFLMGLPFGQYALDPEATCAVQPMNDLQVQMMSDNNSAMMFDVNEDVIAYFEWAVATGAATQDQADQFLMLMTYSSFSFCGDEMEVDIPGMVVVTDTFENGHWYLGDGIGYYLAPLSNAMPGCVDPEAENFNLCALPDETLCIFLPVSCNDPLACNFDETSSSTEDCVYFDTNNFTLNENDFIDLYDLSGCENGYSAWNDMPVPLTQDSLGGPLYFILFAEVEAILIANGYEILATDIANVQMSVCGDTLNYDSQVVGDLDLIWDGYGFPNPTYGGYIVPESSLPAGCPDPNACNFDPCSSPFSADLCTYLELGTILGDTIVTSGNTYTYTFEGGEEGSTYEFGLECGSLEQDGNATAVLTVDFVESCQLCVEETNVNGCSAITCLTLTSSTSSVMALEATTWTLIPNPANHQVSLTWNGVASDWAIQDQMGREVRRFRINKGINTINTSNLDMGQYIMGPLHGSKQRLLILR